jgi:hypothetical protein
MTTVQIMFMELTIEEMPKRWTESIVKSTETEEWKSKRHKDG